ncbi:hypothetical protein, partial [Camelimonas fluminis]|uniref:hypothetical protein n=1 Tax=Camelimonas fluminis TaxID=1576911 RepID=UPI001AEDA722
MARQGLAKTSVKALQAVAAKVVEGAWKDTETTRKPFSRLRSGPAVKIKLPALHDPGNAARPVDHCGVTHSRLRWMIYPRFVDEPSLHAVLL